MDEAFFRTDFGEWLRTNLGEDNNWAVTFAVTCWWQWHWRNKTLFEEDFVFPGCPG